MDPSPRLVVVAAVLAMTGILAGCTAAAGQPGAARQAAGASGIPIAFNSAQCGPRWHAAPRMQTFQVHNEATDAAEVDLINPGTGAIFGEITGLGAGTTRPMRVSLGSGEYAFRCIIEDLDPITGPTVRVPGHFRGGRGVLPVTDNDLIGPSKQYHAYVTARLNTLAAQTAALAAGIRSGNLAQARKAWLTAHLTYERLGAAYGTFGEFDAEIDGRPDGLPGGVADPEFTGFYRVEYGLWHGQSARELAGPADQLLRYVRALGKAFPAMEIDLLDLGLRTHEILENAVQFQLSGHDDYGSGSTLATTAANIAGTRELLTILHPLLVTRYPALPQAYLWLARLQGLIDAQRRPGGSWVPVRGLSQVVRERIDAAAGQALQELAPIAVITEPRQT